MIRYDFNMKRMLPSALTSVVGFFSGFQLYAVINLLPFLLSLVEDSGAIDLIVLIAFTVLILSQMELGKRIATHSAASSIRDSVVWQSVAFLIFVLAPQSFWLIIAFVGWLTGFSATQIALGRWTLLSNKIATRHLEATLTLVGVGLGIASAKSISFFIGSADILIYSSLAVTVIASFHTHLFSKDNPGFFGNTQIWFWRDFFRDINILALFGVSSSMGVMIGLMVFFQAKISLALIGFGLFVLISKFLFSFSSPEKIARFAIYFSGLIFAIDFLFSETLIFSSVFFVLFSSIIYTAVRLSAFSPKIPLTTSERMAVHGLGFYLGMAVSGISKLPNITFGETTIGVILFFIVTGYLVSFVPETAKSEN